LVAYRWLISLGAAAHRSAWLQRAKDWREIARRRPLFATISGASVHRARFPTDINLDLVMSSAEAFIAVIDDDGVIRDCLYRLLTSHGYRTEMYASAEEFIRSAIVTEARCLIVDIQLGDISGVELGRHLEDAGLHFPIIFLTGRDDEIARRQAADFGCVAYFTKPFPADLLMDAVDKAIKHNPERR
jgi:CheY-like chemotaxis protein